MKVTLNGDRRDVPDGMTIACLLKDLELDGKPVAVERNREVVSRTCFGEIRLEEGDHIEIVHFVGGG